MCEGLSALAPTVTPQLAGIGWWDHGIDLVVIFLADVFAGCFLYWKFDLGKEKREQKKAETNEAELGQRTATTLLQIVKEVEGWGFALGRKTVGVQIPLYGLDTLVGTPSAWTFPGSSKLLEAAKALSIEMMNWNAALPTIANSPGVWHGYRTPIEKTAEALKTAVANQPRLTGQ